MNRIVVVSVTLLWICGCSTGGLHPEGADVRLRVTASTNNPDKAVIPIEPEFVSERKQFDILVANLQAEVDSVLLHKVVVGIQASALIRDVLADVTLEFSGNTYPLSHIETRDGTTGFLVFAVSRSDEPLLVSNQKQSLTLRARFKAEASGERVKAGISSLARNKTVAVQASNGHELSSEQKTGSVRGYQHTLRRTGAHVEIDDMSADNTTEGVRYEVGMTVTAFATSVSLPWAAYRLRTPESDYSDAGLYYAIEDTVGTTVSDGRMETSLESITVVSTGARLSGDGLAIKKGEQRAVTLSVHLQPQSQDRKQYCFRLDAMSYEAGQADNSRLLVLPDTLRTVCASS